MPRVLLTPAQRAAQKAREGDAALRRSLNHYKVDAEQRWADMARELGTAETTLRRWRSRPDIITLADLRRLAALTGMTAEDWLAVGGY